MTPQDHMVTSNDIYWLAGLLEGEGSFQWSGTGRSLCVVLGMNDKDVVERASIVMAGSLPRDYTATRTGNRHWRTAVYGARAASVMMTLYTLLGVRRRAKIRALLAEWKTRPGIHGHRKRVWRARNDTGRFISRLC